MYGKPTVVYTPDLHNFPPLQTTGTSPDAHSTGYSTTTSLTHTAALSTKGADAGREAFEQRINSQVQQLENWKTNSTIW